MLLKRMVGKVKKRRRITLTEMLEKLGSLRRVRRAGRWLKSQLHLQAPHLPL